MNKHKLCLIYNPAARGEKARLLDSELHFIAQEATILGSKNLEPLNLWQPQQ